MHVDVKKISDERLSSCFSKETIGFRVALLNLDGNEVKSAKSLTIKQQGFLTKGSKSDYPICESIPEYKCSTRKDFVVYHNNRDIKNGVLVTEVVNFVG